MPKTLLAAALCIALLTACGPPKQSIPISTNPLGATVYADGALACTTPCSISLAKTSEHLITVVKEGYEQQDLTITRQFRPDKALRDAAIGGILTGKDPKVIAGEAAKKIDEQERSGEAYVLKPAIIKLILVPATNTL